MTRLLQILPRVPPAVCGIGDYAWRLAQAMRDQHGFQSSFLSAGTSWIQPEGETEFPVFRLPELSASSLLAWMNLHRGAYDAVLLHMSPYGYQKRAVPFWMASAWRQLSMLPGRPALLTMFHELYASGSMRTSAFWLQPLQKRILRQIATASDGLRTNREQFSAWLDQNRGIKTRKTAIMPIFSNLGELAELPDWKDRARRMVVFTPGIHGRHPAGSAIHDATELCRKLGMNELLVIGGESIVPQSPDALQFVQHAFLPANEFSRLMSNSRMAFTGYNPFYLGKSGIFAGFASHGLAVVTTATTPDLPDGLREGREILNLNACLHKNSAAFDVEGIGRGLHHWYAGHTLAKTAASYAQQLRGMMEGSN